MIVVSDTGVIIAFAKIRKLNILKSIFGKIFIILLIDDKAGRRVAKRLKIKTIGTMGVLIVAKKRGLIENVTNIITEMRENGYWLSDSIIETTKRLAGESGDKRET